MTQTLSIGTVPPEFKPISIVYTMLGLTLNNVPAYFSISASGTIFLRVSGNIVAKTALYASFTYVI